jgi:hypothetical protein
VRNKTVLQRFDEEKNILHTIKRMQAHLIGHSMYRNCLLKHGTEGKSEGRMEVQGRRRRRRKKLLDGLKNRGRWKLKEDAGHMPCIPDGHLYRVTNTRCRIGTVFSFDDGHTVARNM